MRKYPLDLMAGCWGLCTAVAADCSQLLYNTVMKNAVCLLVSVPVSSDIFCSSLSTSSVNFFLSWCVYCVYLQVAGKKYTQWDDFLVEGRRGGQQEMTLGDLIRHIKVHPPYSSELGKYTFSSHPVLLDAYFMHVSPSPSAHNAHCSK